jgi:hypothetical protein
VTRTNARQAFIAVTLLLVGGLYAYLTFTAPAPTRPAAPGFELLEPWKTIVQITFILPFLASWAFGAFAVDYLLETARRLPAGAKAVRMFRLLGYGVLALVLGSWISSLISQVRGNFFPEDAYMQMALTVAQNYAYVLFPLVGFTLIYLASTTRITETGPKHQSQPVALLLIAILGALWTAIVFTNDARQVTTSVYGRPTYYINDALIILTLVTPTLAAWLLGITGALHFSDLESGGDAKLRKAFTRIVHGLMIAVINSMILNGLLSAGSERLLAAGLVFLLVIIYIFVFMTVFSYWMICRGAKILLDTYEHQE